MRCVSRTLADWVHRRDFGVAHMLRLIFCRCTGVGTIDRLLLCVAINKHRLVLTKYILILHCYLAIFHGHVAYLTIRNGLHWKMEIKERENLTKAAELECTVTGNGLTYKSKCSLHSAYVHCRHLWLDNRCQYHCRLNRCPALTCTLGSCLSTEWRC